MIQLSKQTIIIVCCIAVLALTITLVVRSAKEKYDTSNTVLFPIPNDYKQEATEICSSYNRGIIPSKQEDCPDTSFSLVAPSLTKVYVGENHASCMQLQPMNYPNCYSDAEGKYKPWFGRINAYSP